MTFPLVYEEALKLMFQSELQNSIQQDSYVWNIAVY